MNGSLRRMVVPAILLGAVLGIAGGVAIGWFVWPVRWYDTDPSDLRLGHQIDYVVMVADSYATTGDLETARLRLYELIDDDTSWAQVANLVVRVAVAMETDGDGASAQRIRRLYNDAGLPSPAQEPFTVTPARPTGTGVWIGLGALGAMALVATVWLVGPAQILAVREGPEAPPQYLDGLPSYEPASAPRPGGGAAPTPVAAAPAPEAGGAAEHAGGPEIVPDDVADLDEDEWEAALNAIGEEGAGAIPPPTVVAHVQAEPHDDEDDWEEDDDWDEEDDLLAADGGVVADGSTSAQSDHLDSDDEHPGEAGVPPEGLDEEGDVAARVQARTPSGDVLGVYEAEYRHGDRDFDCSFSIESPTGAFLGECGVGVADILSADDTRHVEAFEVWLFDKTDIRTVSTVLVSEGAANDPGLREEVADKGKVLVAATGLTVRLETLALRVTATVRSCAFTADGGEPGAHFEHLHMEIVAERASDDA